MKSIFTILILVTFVILSIYVIYYFFNNQTQREVSIDTTNPNIENQTNPSDEKTELKETNPVELANPASTFCIENGGKLEIISNNDGSQIGICELPDNKVCEEWTFFRGDCDYLADSELIEEAMRLKGYSFEDMEIKIQKHLGKYIEASLTPTNGDAGGGYIFAVKENDKIIILADGNGSLLCEDFADYPDYPSYLVPECYDKTTEQTMIR